MVSYFIESGILLTVFYLFFILVIRKETYFQLNRIFLLVGVSFSLLLPLLPPIRWITSENEISGWIETITITNTISADVYTSKDLINPLLIIYLAGLSWFLLRFISGLGKITYFCFRFPSTSISGKKAFVLEGDHAPFTFFNILFISKKDLLSDRDESIIKHELEHIRRSGSWAGRRPGSPDRG